MRRVRFLIGLSTVAFAAGTVSAQSTNTQSVSTAEFNSVDARNDYPDNVSDSIVIQQSGAAHHQAFVTQTGAQDYSESQQSGDGTGNIVAHTQIGVSHYAYTNQSGQGNLSEISQAFTDNSGTIHQTGQRNQAEIDQGDFHDSNNNPCSIYESSISSCYGYNDMVAGAPDPATYVSEGAHPATSNVALITQNGSDLSAGITQAVDDAPVSGGSASQNSATINQSGTGSDISASQRSRGNIARISVWQGGLGNAANASDSTQSNDFYVLNGSGNFTYGTPTATNDPKSGNLVDVAITGQQNASDVEQDGVQNTAMVSMLGGGAGNTSDPATADPLGRSVPLNRPQGNSSTVTQTGRNLYYAISAGGAASSGGSNGQGNVAGVAQGALMQSKIALVSTTIGVPASNQATTNYGPGTNHSATVYQRGILDYVDISQLDNTGFLVTGDGRQIVNPNNSSLTLRQAQSGSVADVSQLSFNSTASIEQSGTNTALVSQGNRAEPGFGAAGGGNNLTTINQTDEGDLQGGTGSGTFNSPGNTGAHVTQANYAAVSQNGRSNTITIDQDAVNASASVWQQSGLGVDAGTQNSKVTVEQGTGVGANANPAPNTGNSTSNNGSGAINLTANVTQSGNAGTATNVNGNGFDAGVFIVQDGQNLNATATQSGGTVGASGTASNNVLVVSQVNSNSSATVTQGGTGQWVVVDQRSTKATLANPSLVTVTQSGTNNYAIARQTETAGASGAGDPVGSGYQFGYANARAAGVNSAELVILQSSNGNSGTVEQRGLGQYARLEQTGNSNVGGILQQSTAINATAILQQTGDSNSFYITQDQAGQYIHVLQNGNSNTVATTTQSGSGASPYQGGMTSTTSQP